MPKVELDYSHINIWVMHYVVSIKLVCYNMWDGMKSYDKGIQLLRVSGK